MSSKIPVDSRNEAITSKGGANFSFSTTEAEGKSQKVPAVSLNSNRITSWEGASWVHEARKRVSRKMCGPIIRVTFSPITLKEEESTVELGAFAVLLVPWEALSEGAEGI